MNTIYASLSTSNNQDIEEQIGKYQIGIYSLFQVCLTALIIQVCRYHSFRGKWSIMITFSVFVSVDYIGQISSNILSLYKVNKYVIGIMLQISILGELGSYVLYLYLVVVSIRPSLIRKAKYLMAKFHVWTAILPVGLTLGYFAACAINVYLGINDELEIYMKYIQVGIYFSITFIATWNIVLRKMYYKKYKQTRCYSWTTVGFFAFNAVFELFLVLTNEKSRQMFIFCSSMNLLFDLGPMLAFMQFGLYYRIALTRDAGGRSNSLNESMSSPLHRRS